MENQDINVVGSAKNDIICQLCLFTFNNDIPANGVVLPRETEMQTARNSVSLKLCIGCARRVRRALELQILGRPSCIHGAPSDSSCRDCDGEYLEKLIPKETTFQDRVRGELKDLRTKIDKLTAFVGSKTFLSIDQDEQYRLTVQLHSMNAYGLALENRIKHFDE